MDSRPAHGTGAAGVVAKVLLCYWGSYDLDDMLNYRFARRVRRAQAPLRARW